MRSQDLINNLDILKFDSISKFNIYNLNKNLTIFNVKSLRFVVMLDSSDKLFYKKILVLSDLVSK